MTHECDTEYFQKCSADMKEECFVFVKLLMKYKTISDGGITVNFSIIKVHTSNCQRIAGDHRIPRDHGIAAAGIIE